MPVPSRILPSQEYLRECLDYDPENGALTWRSRPVAHFHDEPHARTWNARYANKPAGRMVGNYKSVGIKKVDYYAHRVIWKWVTGEEPPLGVIDHIDRCMTNNRWTNLRSATFSQSLGNRGLFNTNTTGLTCVYPYRNSFYVNFCNKRLGRFNTKEEAFEAYCAAAKAHFGEFWSPE
jgi:hypothetical protein